MLETDQSPIHVEFGGFFMRRANYIIFLINFAIGVFHLTNMCYNQSVFVHII